MCLSELGYEAVSLTPDAGLLDPFRLDKDEVARVRALAEDHGLELTVETGSRYLLDARKKHFPTLLEDDPRERARRVDFLERCVDLAAELGASCVSFWSGAAPDGSTGDGGGGREELWQRLAAGASAVLARAREQGVALAFEPEPGMFVARPAGYEELVTRLGAQGDELGLCLDVGHCLCTGDLPVERVIERLAQRLVVVHLDDIAGGVHEHLMFGEGELDLAATLDALLRVGFDGVAAVELARDSHRAPEAARAAMAHLRAALAGGGR